MAKPRITAAARVQRLLAMLQWAAGHPDGVEVAALCARFRLTPEALVKELDLASMVGADSVHYDDMPFEVYLEGGLVFVRLISFRRAMRLTPEEGLALVAAADVLVDPEHPEEPLARAVAKLGHLLHVTPGEGVDVDLDPDGGPTGRLLRQAIDDRTQVTFTYWSYGRDAVARRTVDPWGLFNEGGAWYLTGRDRDLDAERRFRLDRMEDPVALPEGAGPRPRRVQPSLGVDEAAPQVVLDLAGPARWVADAHPVLAVEPGEGDRLRVTLAVAGPSWLQRLVLQLGADATVVSIDEELGDRGIAAAAASKVLTRYRV